MQPGLSGEDCAAACMVIATRDRFAHSTEMFSLLVFSAVSGVPAVAAVPVVAGVSAIVGHPAFAGFLNLQASLFLLASLLLLGADDCPVAGVRFVAFVHSVAGICSMHPSSCCRPFSS